MVAGFVCVDKPRGLSSAQVVAKVKRALQGAKVGHLGTLDPFATGLLVCPVGRATRLASFLSGGHKQYQGRVQLGIRTSSSDSEGEILSQCTEIPERTAVEEAVFAQKGLISQRPPEVSAIKVNGKRSYELARSGEMVSLLPRLVDLVDVKIDSWEEDGFRFTIKTGPGFYVRAWARDIGDTLGCGAILNELRRIASVPFTLDTAVSLEEVSLNSVTPWFKAFPDLPCVAATVDEVALLELGNQRAADSIGARCGETARAIYALNDLPVGLIEWVDAKSESGPRWKLGLHLAR